MEVVHLVHATPNLGRETTFPSRDPAPTKQTVSYVGDNENVVHHTLLQPKNYDVLSYGVNNSDVINRDTIVDVDTSGNE